MFLPIRCVNAKLLTRNSLAISHIFVFIEIDYYLYYFSISSAVGWCLPTDVMRHALESWLSAHRHSHIVVRRHIETIHLFIYSIFQQNDSTKYISDVGLQFLILIERCCVRYCVDSVKWIHRKCYGIGIRFNVCPGSSPQSNEEEAKSAARYNQKIETKQCSVSVALTTAQLSPLVGRLHHNDE